jgi:nitrite reductase/ring-hydroxylating ferredoxin subunit
MNGWVEVGTRAELLPGEFKVVWDGDTPIAVYNIDGALYAIEDTCTHDGGDLAGGDVIGFEVECRQLSGSGSGWPDLEPRRSLNSSSQEVVEGAQVPC